MQDLVLGNSSRILVYEKIAPICIRSMLDVEKIIIYKFNQ